MKVVSESASKAVAYTDIQQFPAMYRWVFEDSEYILCNPEVQQMPDGTMICVYIVIVDGKREGFRVLGELGQDMMWTATDVTGFLQARGRSPSEAMLRILL